VSLPAHASLLDPSTSHPDDYARRRPEDTVLYQVVAEHWPAFRERAEEAGGLPKFIIDEFEAYLECGRLDAGCLHLVCRRCGHSMLVALSCKRRAFCPSCLGRRMADTAIHLERAVLPAVAIRHWICSLPWGLRALLGYDRKLCSEVVGAFVGEMFRSLRRRAKRLLGLASVTDAHPGAVAAVHRADSALRLNVHFHVLGLDGVYVRDDSTGSLVFHPLPAPTQAEVAEVARRTAARIEQLLRKHGRSIDPELADDNPHPLELDDPALAACYTAAARGVGITGDRAGQPTLRLIFPDDAPDRIAGPPEFDEPVAEVRGVNVHAKQMIDGRDRARLERLCKYIMRPPLAQDRLTHRSGGLLQLELKHAWKDGTQALVFEPQELISRLVAMVPPPRAHQLRYFGVLSSHSSLRREVVPTPPADDAHQPAPAEGDQLELFDGDRPTTHTATRHRWSYLLKHVFRADLEHCPRCGGPMRWLEVATDAEAIARLLTEHGLAPRAPPVHAVPLGQLRLPFAG